MGPILDPIYHRILILYYCILILYYCILILYYYSASLTTGYSENRVLAWHSIGGVKRVVKPDVDPSAESAVN
jgi:hypothetical protein